MRKTLGVIPARYGSTRFPGKPLALLAGKPMIEHVYEACLKSSTLDLVVVATDDPRIEAVVKDFNGNVVMTSTDHATGTDRLVEAVSHYPDYDIIVNIQGDEPGIEPELIDGVAGLLLENDTLNMSTGARPFHGDEDPADPNRVKVVCAANGNALYFSRSLIPYDRDEIHPTRFLHLGIYGFTRSFLLGYNNLPESRLEKAESLEQLRALESGYSIAVHTVKDSLPGVDTPEDLERMEKYLLSR